MLNRPGAGTRHHHALTPEPLATAAPAIGTPKARDHNEQHKAELNRVRVAASEARGADRAVGYFEYDGQLLTLLVRLRTATGDRRYLSEAEANAYGPGQAARRRFDGYLRRAMTALVAEIVSGRIKPFL